MAQPIAPEIAKYGHHIFVYNNLRTNQVIYSLTRTLNNNSSLKQLPYLGKKTVPAKLRKDLWHPLAFVSFPSPHQGLAAYRKLREFRRLHETTYDLSLIEDKSSKSYEARAKKNDPYEQSKPKTLLNTKLRGKVLMNQKANSVADLAAVLIQQARAPDHERIARNERRITAANRLKRSKGASQVRKNPLPLNQIQGSVEGVQIRWANILDAEFAATWPAEVVHDSLEVSRYTAAWPPLPEGVRERVKQERQRFAERVENRGEELFEGEEGRRGAEALENVISGEKPKKGLRERLFGGFGGREKSKGSDEKTA